MSEQLPPVVENISKFTLDAVRITGLKEFLNLENFYGGLIDEAIQLQNDGKGYIIVLADERTHAIFQMFVEFFRTLNSIPSEYLSLRDEWQKVPRFSEFTPEELNSVNSHVLTAENLTASAQELAGYYREKKHFPKILAVQELLFHGRTMNALYLALSDETFRWVPTDLGQVATESFLRAFEPRIYAKTTMSMLLFDILARKAIPAQKGDPGFLNDLMGEHLRLRSILAIPNNPSKLFGRMPSQTLALPPAKFVKTTTYLYQVKETVFTFLPPSTERFSAICAVGMRECILPALGEAEKKWSLVLPHVFFGKMTRAELASLYSKTLSVLPPDAKTALARYTSSEVEAGGATEARWAAIVARTVLEYLLLREFFSQGEPTRFLFSRETLARELQQIGGPKITPALDALLSWRPGSWLLGECFGVLKTPLWTASDGNNLGYTGRSTESLPDYSATSIAVQNALVNAAISAKRNVYERSVSSIPFSAKALAKWGEISFREMLQLINKNLGTEDDRPHGQSLADRATIHQALAVLTHLYDWGGFTVAFDPNDLSDKIFA